MTINELLEQLKKLGINNPAIPEKTIKRWAFTEGIISKPTPAQAKGRGQAADWPEEALEEVAAVWAVRHNEKGARITAEMAKIIKSCVRNVYCGWAVYKIPPVTRSPEGIVEIQYTDIDLQFAPEGIHRPDGSDAIDLFPGSNKKDRVTFLGDLIVKWIATVAKVRHTREQELWARQAGKSSYYVWPFERGAVVTVGYRCTPLEGGRDQDGQRAISQYCEFNSLKIGGESDGEDKIFLFEYNIDLECGIDPRIYIANNISFNAPSLSSIKRMLDDSKKATADLKELQTSPQKR
jgi:hypothetical protein